MHRCRGLLLRRGLLLGICTCINQLSTAIYLLYKIIFVPCSMCIPDIQGINHHHHYLKQQSQRKKKLLGRWEQGCRFKSSRRESEELTAHCLSIMQQVATKLLFLEEKTECILGRFSRSMATQNNQINESLWPTAIESIVGTYSISHHAAISSVLMIG